MNEDIPKEYSGSKYTNITQKEMAGIIGKSERIIKTRTVEMQEKGLKNND